MKLVSWALAATLCLGSAAPALALNQQQKAAALEFAINNSVWVMYHEVGHLFVDQFRLPVLGAREEDAADTLATVMLLQQDTDEAEQTLRDTVEGWFMSDLVIRDAEYDKADFYDPHALDVVRAYGMACLMVGKEYVKYRPMASEIGMDSGRVADCEYDYELADRSWSAALEPFYNRDKKRSAEIEVIYDDAPLGLKRFAKMAEDARLLEEIAEEIEATFALTRDVTFRAMSCEDANAFYDSDLSEIQFCYEYVKFYYDIKADALEASGEDGTVAAGDEDEGDSVPRTGGKLEN
jgi:hypothetical protein